MDKVVVFRKCDGSESEVELADFSSQVRRMDLRRRHTKYEIKFGKWTAHVDWANEIRLVSDSDDLIVHADGVDTVRDVDCHIGGFDFDELVFITGLIKILHIKMESEE